LWTFVHERGRWDSKKRERGEEVKGGQRWDEGGTSVGEGGEGEGGS